jgi:mannan endo-1,4-beta-mannosidase
MHLLLALAGFVSVQGADFVENGKPFHFVGANLHVTHGQPARKHYEDIIAAAARDGLTVGRVWALGEGELDAPEWAQKFDLFRAGPEGWIEDAYTHLDRVLVAARKHGMRLIIVLSNNNPDYGGAPAYLKWFGIDRFADFGAGDRFYSDPRARKAFAAHIERLLSRKNSVDGTPYVDDPAIFGWELMNESEVSSDEGARVRREWIAWAAALIKSKDKNHLVAPGLSTGSGLGYRFTEERDDWIAAHEVPGIDYCDAHLYMHQRAAVRRPADIDPYVDDLAQLARFVIKKPLVIGEFSFPTREKVFRTAAPQKWFEHLLAQAHKDGVGGALAWIYQTKTDYQNEYEIYADGDETDGVRKAMARAAQVVLQPVVLNPRLSEARGRTPILDLHVDLAGRSAPLSSWKDGVLAFEPDEFARAHWEQGGTYAEGWLVHAYGARTGYFEWKFRAPPEKPTAIELRMRLSSDYPGWQAPVDGNSHVIVTIDGREVATLEAYPDDGHGRWYTVRIDEPSTIGRAGTHTLRLEVKPGAGAHGICVYGRNGKQGGVADAAPATIRWITSRE